MMSIVCQGVVKGRSIPKFPVNLSSKTACGNASLILAMRVLKFASDEAQLLFAFFNNHWQGYVPRNAVSMMRTLQLPFRELSTQKALPDEDVSE